MFFGIDSSETGVISIKIKQHSEVELRRSEISIERSIPLLRELQRSGIFLELHSTKTFYKYNASLRLASNLSYQSFLCSPKRVKYLSE